ncbi:MAG: flagellar basal body-associated FliL family protein [Opitutaceae bacterium]
MPGKPEAKDAKEGKEPKDAAASPPERPAAADAPKRSWQAWLPAAVIVIAAPAASWGVTRFVLLPRLERRLGAPASAVPAAAPSAAAADGKLPAIPPSADFKDVVVNLAGTMGTRYLKTSFAVTGSVPNFKDIFEDNRMRLKDVTINVLSSLTLADLEEPGSKNVLREKLVNAYNQALGRKLCDQVYFSDFVVQ